MTVMGTGTDPCPGIGICTVMVLVVPVLIGKIHYLKLNLESNSVTISCSLVASSDRRAMSSALVSSIVNLVPLIYSSPAHAKHD